MTEPTKQPRPGVPVPPESLAHGWVNRVATSVYDDLADAAAWGADEQLRLCVEREELAGIIDDLLQFARECMLQGDVIPIDETREETWADFLARARQAVERLRGATTSDPAPALPRDDLVARVEALEHKVSAIQARMSPIGGKPGLYDSAAHLRKLSQRLRDMI
jgi:hypothetical protein